MKANIGDKVHVKATVLRVVDRDGHHLLNLGDDHLGDFYAPADCIVHVETRPIQVGDKVRPINRANIGDTVHVKATVFQSFPDNGIVTLESTARGCVVRWQTDVSEIVHVETRPIQVGDKVRHLRGDGDEYEVLGVHGEWLWVAREGRDPYTNRVDKFQRVQP